MSHPDPYTHNFIYSIGDGGKWIEGECEFNKDKITTFKIINWSEPLSKGTLKHFNELMDLMETIFVEAGGIKKISVKLKP